MTRIAVEPNYDKTLVGFWCDDCQLPSLIKVPIVMITIDGVTDAGTISSCANCEGEDEDGNLRGC